MKFFILQFFKDIFLEIKLATFKIVRKSAEQQKGEKILFCVAFYSIGLGPTVFG
jgi:hypothetical protein